VRIKIIEQECPLNPRSKEDRGWHSATNGRSHHSATATWNNTSRAYGIQVIAPLASFQMASTE